VTDRFEIAKLPQNFPRFTYGRAVKVTPTYPTSAKSTNFITIYVINSGFLVTDSYILIVCF